MFDEFYQQNVRGWAFTKNVTAGLCTIDLRDGSWRTADVTVAPYFLGSTIDFHKGGNASLYELEGWAGAEDGGTWTVGAFSTLLLNLPAPPSSDLTLTFRAHAFVPPQRPTFHEQLLVNNSEVLAWSVTDQQSQIEKKVHVSRSVVDSRLVRIEFRNRDPRSPAELGISIDGRRLSLALEKIEVSQSSL